eukprot:3716714-Alexandrium_andersonii.AAC.1
MPTWSSADAGLRAFQTLGLMEEGELLERTVLSPKPSGGSIAGSALARPCAPVSYTHLTLPTICSV